MTKNKQKERPRIANFKKNEAGLTYLNLVEKMGKYLCSQIVNRL